jgi:hypothetical protein
MEGKGCTSDVPILMMLPNENIKSIKNDDHCKVEESEPSGIWLKFTLENKCVSIYSLCVEGFVELNVCDADRAIA